VIWRAPGSGRTDARRPRSAVSARSRESPMDVRDNSVQHPTLLRRDVLRPRPVHFGDNRLPELAAVLDDVPHTVRVGLAVAAGTEPSVGRQPISQSLEQSALAVRPAHRAVHLSRGEVPGPVAPCNASLTETRRPILESLHESVSGRLLRVHGLRFLSLGIPANLVARVTRATGQSSRAASPQAFSDTLSSSRFEPLVRPGEHRRPVPRMRACVGCSARRHACTRRTAVHVVCAIP
jgi:hypothetical protein